MRGALPTIKYLMEHGARVILCSHLGRPKGEFNMKYSLKPVAERLSELLGVEVKMADDVIGESAKALAASHARMARSCCWRTSASIRKRKKNDPAFAKELASLADSLCQRRLRHRAPRACLHRGRCRITCPAVCRLS